MKKTLSSIFQYVILLVIVLIIENLIGRLWELPVYLDLVANFIVGMVAIFITIDEEKLKKMKLIPIIRTHFEAMNMVNEKIGQGAKDGSFKGSLQFSWGLVYLILYSLFINTLTLIIKAIIAKFSQTEFIFDFLPAFALMLGAVPIAYLKWLGRFYQDQKKLIKAAQQGDRKNAIIGKMAYTAKLWVLFITYFIWLIGEIIFLSTNPYWAQYLNVFAIAAVLYWVLLTIILAILRKSAKSTA
jgi:hypothetical protein